MRGVDIVDAPLFFVAEFARIWPLPILGKCPFEAGCDDRSYARQSVVHRPPSGTEG